MIFIQLQVRIIFPGVGEVPSLVSLLPMGAFEDN